jgi:hypothetical protein
MATKIAELRDSFAEPDSGGIMAGKGNANERSPANGSLLSGPHCK